MSKGQHDNELKGVLFKNEGKREGKRDADYRGQCEIGRVQYFIDAWINTSRDGKTRYMSLSFKPKQAAQHQGASANPPAQQAKPAEPEFDDGIPF